MEYSIGESTRLDFTSAAPVPAAAAPIRTPEQKEKLRKVNKMILARNMLQHNLPCDDTVYCSIYDSILDYINKNCPHEFITDYIDVDCDRGGIYIKYCSICHETVSPESSSSKS